MNIWLTKKKIMVNASVEADFLFICGPPKSPHHNEQPDLEDNDFLEVWHLKMKCVIDERIDWLSTYLFMYLMSATCYANLCGTPIIKCKLGRRQQIFPVPSRQRGAVLLSSQNEFCRDYRCNHSLHVWLSFQQWKKAQSPQSESITCL